MSTDRMHENEVDTDFSLVRRLLVEQFPHWADLPITRIPSAGTDNAIYRLGSDMAVRLPRIDWAVGQVAKEHEWMPRLAPLLPLDIPKPLAMGEPGEGYPWCWSIYRWLSGENARLDEIEDPCDAATALAGFIVALQKIDTTGGPFAVDHNVRGCSLALRDEGTRQSIAAMHGMIDTNVALVVWETALQAAEWDRAPVWFHGDLLPGNLLFRQGRLSAVIDFGGLAVGDPACDLMIAWGLFTGESRDVFRSTLAVDDATWTRGRGHALSQAMIFIPYYLKTNPGGVANARLMLDAVLADYAANG